MTFEFDCQECPGIYNYQSYPSGWDWSCPNPNCNGHLVIVTAIDPNGFRSLYWDDDEFNTY